MIEQIPPNSIEHLYGPEEVPYEEDELVVVCLLRDGRPYVKSFIEHYTSLGIKHLFFLDNRSTDATVQKVSGVHEAVSNRAFRQEGAVVPVRGHRRAL